jgi:ankyrin repeat protein
MTNASASSAAQYTPALNDQDNEGKTQLHHAIISESWDQFDSLLQAGIAVDIKDVSENQALHYAVLSGNVVVIRKLLQFGADVNARGQLGRSLLHLTFTGNKALSEAEALVDLLLQYNATRF